MDTLIAQLGVALAIGLLVGLERGWRERDAPDRSRTAARSTTRRGGRAVIRRALHLSDRIRSPSLEENRS